MRTEKVREAFIILSVILLAVGIYLLIFATVFSIGAHSGGSYRSSLYVVGLVLIAVCTITLALVTSSARGRVPRDFGFRELLMTLGIFFLLMGLAWMVFLAVWYFRDFTDVFRFLGHFVLWAPMSLVMMMIGIVLTIYGLTLPIGAPSGEGRPDNGMVRFNLRALTVGLAMAFVGIGLIIFMPPWLWGYPPHFVLSMMGPTLHIIGILVLLMNLRRRSRRDPWSEPWSPK